MVPAWSKGVGSQINASTEEVPRLKVFLGEIFKFRLQVDVNDGSFHTKMTFEYNIIPYSQHYLPYTQSLWFLSLTNCLSNAIHGIGQI